MQFIYVIIDNTYYLVHVYLYMYVYNVAGKGESIHALNLWWDIIGYIYSN